MAVNKPCSAANDSSNVVLRPCLDIQVFCHTNLTKVLLAKYTPPPLCKQFFESCTPDASVYMGMCALGDIWIGSCMGRLPSLSLLNIMINFGRTGQGEHYLFTSVLIRQVGDWFLPPFAASK